VGGYESGCGCEYGAPTLPSHTQSPQPAASPAVSPMLSPHVPANSKGGRPKRRRGKIGSHGAGSGTGRSKADEKAKAGASDVADLGLDTGAGVGHTTHGSNLSKRAAAKQKEVKAGSGANLVASSGRFDLRGKHPVGTPLSLQWGSIHHGCVVVIPTPEHAPVNFMQLHCRDDIGEIVSYRFKLVCRYVLSKSLTDAHTGNCRSGQLRKRLEVVGAASRLPSKTLRGHIKKHLVLPYETCLVGHPTARNERGFEMAKHLRDEILREMGPDHADGHVPTRYIHETHG
jgi:hypothetical protein